MGLRAENAGLSGRAPPPEDCQTGSASHQKNHDRTLKTRVSGKRCTQKPTTIPPHVLEALSLDPVLADIVEACAGLSRKNLEDVLTHVTDLADSRGGEA